MTAPIQPDPPGYNIFRDGDAWAIRRISDDTVLDETAVTRNEAIAIALSDSGGNA